MFLAKSEYLQKIKRLADMAKELRVNVYIWGEKGVGKTFLAKYIAPNAIVNPNAPTINPVIIENFDKNPVLDFKNNFLIATGTEPLNKDLLKRYFTMDIEIKPLKDHPEDIEEFIKLFTSQAKEELKINHDIKIENPDISENLNSLKRQIYKKYLLPQNKDEILELLYNYYLKNHATYEEEIKDFEKTLFKAMREKYGSKLQISEKLKINRVTLTKKMKALNV
ncbi:Fis family transcriptional regulator [Caminibacter pacificus]|uniref:Fis family transcriptional regulator n=1 Tax=Caminibacter pacificus TaxID=1424653 RepID=A0AAJ4UY06_9BACT|nr:Fis family transcriptional regulator [Caminibacter pacificus]QCI27651.1 Fis family transcriptional regulator [Caminibacter pacificus]ROR40174.1 sigma-54-interacting transcriptional regulator [Caminibacter pacificus]